MLKVGDRVICIDGTPIHYLYDKGVVFPEKGRVYTVEYKFYDSKNNECIYLDKIFNDIDYLSNYTGESEPYFDARRFVKLHDDYLMAKLDYIEKKSDRLFGDLF